jgi:hypothetical protein
MYSSKLLNYTKRNYTTIKKKALVMIYALHKFRHYLLDNRFTFYVDHMPLVDLVNKPQVFGKLARWLLLFLGYNLKFIYKHGRPHLMVNALSGLPN